jgi:hypothetical protein
MLVALLGCREPRDPRPREEPAPVGDPATLPRLEEEPPPSAVWPTEVESLRRAVDQFVSVDDCIAALRARTPTAVSEGIADLGYDAFFDHVCHAMAAVKSGSVEECDALSITTARAGCRRRLAIVHGRPGACPEDRVTPGREPLCVAWAARDRALCRATDATVACRAVLDGDAGSCARLRGGDAERCRALVRRFAEVIGDEATESATDAPAFTLEVRKVAEDPLLLERDVLAQGVRLVPQGCTYAVALANPRGEPSLDLAFGDEPPRFHLELVIPPGAEAPMTLRLGADAAVLSVVTPTLGPLTSLVGAEGTVRIDRFEPRLGGAIRGRVRGSLRHGNERVSVEGRFTTFVRDLDALPGHCTQ